MNRKQATQQIINGKPWFSDKDIVAALRYQNGSRDINPLVDSEDKNTIVIPDRNKGAAKMTTP